MNLAALTKLIETWIDQLDPNKLPLPGDDRCSFVRAQMRAALAMAAPAQPKADEPTKRGRPPIAMAS